MVKGQKVILEEGKFPEVCSGCRLCEIVCSFKHEDVFAPWLSRIKVVTIKHLIDFPQTCKLCKNPPCKKACPVEAISRDEITGAQKIDEELCIGCGECVLACPFGAISIPEEKIFPIVCDLCNGEPECIRACPTQVLKLRNEESVVKGKIEKNALQYHSEEIEEKISNSKAQNPK